MHKQAFISWSGEASNSRARALKNLFSDVLPEADIFMSSHDIPAGSLWLDQINKALEGSVAGVLLLTPDNLGSPWIHFEAGALATRVEKRMVIPILCGVDQSAINQSPLKSFQALKMDKEAVLKVCKAFVEALGISRSETTLSRAFEKWWPDYENALVAPLSPQTAKSPPSMDDLFEGLLELQRHARSQSDAISKLSKSLPAIAASVIDQGPFGTTSSAQADILRNSLIALQNSGLEPAWSSINALTQPINALAKGIRITPDDLKQMNDLMAVRAKEAQRRKIDKAEAENASEEANESDGDEEGSPEQRK